MKYEFEGKLSIAVMQTPGVFPYMYLLDTGEVRYELQFDDESEYRNIESRPGGEVWYAGGWYGVDGTLDGKTIDVAAIEYLGLPPTAEAAPEPEPEFEALPPVVRTESKAPADPLQNELSLAQLQYFTLLEDCDAVGVMIEHFEQRIAGLTLELEDPDVATNVSRRIQATQDLQLSRSDLAELEAVQVKCNKRLTELQSYIESLEAESRN